MRHCQSEKGQTKYANLKNAKKSFQHQNLKISFRKQFPCFSNTIARDDHFNPSLTAVFSQFSKTAQLSRFAKIPEDVSKNKFLVECFRFSVGKHFEINRNRTASDFFRIRAEGKGKVYQKQEGFGVRPNTVLCSVFFIAICICDLDFCEKSFWWKFFVQFGICERGCGWVVPLSVKKELFCAEKYIIEGIYF